jgi:hypothetical protein
MRARSLVVLFGTFLTIIAGLGSGQAQSATPAFTISASNTTMPASGMGAIPFTLTSVNGFAGSVVVGLVLRVSPPDRSCPNAAMAL